MGKYTKNISEYLAKEMDVIQHLDPEELKREPFLKPG